MIRLYTYRDLRDAVYLEAACKLHNISFPYDNVDCETFASFILSDPNFDEDITYFAVGDGDRVLGFLAGVEVVKEPREAIEKFRDVLFEKDVVVDPHLPADLRRDVLSTLLKEFENVAKARDKKSVVLYAYAPYYFMPGINIL